MRQSLQSFCTESKACISTSVVTVFYVLFSNASTDLEHQFPHCPDWDTLLTQHFTVLHYWTYWYWKHGLRYLNLIVIFVHHTLLDSGLKYNFIILSMTFFEDWNIKKLVTMSYLSSPKILLHPQLPQYYANSLLFAFL